MKSLHKLLADSLERHYGDEAAAPSAVRDLLAEIDANFREMEADKERLASSLAASSRELIHATEEMRAEKELLTVTLHSIGEGVITSDTDGKITLINRVAQELTGWSQEDAVGESIDHVFYVVDEHSGRTYEGPMSEIMSQAGTMIKKETGVLVARDSTRRDISHSAAPIRNSLSKVIGLVVVFRDITEARKLEEERLRASRLESVGLLAGGIAHDFNNILTILLGNLSLTLTQLSEHPEAAELVEEGLRAGSRAVDLTRQLLTFSKGGTPIKTTASVGDLVRESAIFALRGSNVRCELRIAPDLFPVEIDKGQIHQVVNNLVINADQAMPDGGNLLIGAENLVSWEENGMILPAPRNVKVFIRDQGVGIPDEALDRIFDPYFTTKRRGTGLGLATSYSIVKKHGGLLTVDSKKGEGTTFYIYLPASDRPLPLDEGGAKVPIEGRRGHLLIMDDEEPILALVDKMLSHLGYRVDLARDGGEALSLYCQAMEEDNPYDVVILDLTIPGGMGGCEAALRVLEVDPQAAVIASSGYSNDPVMSSYDEYGFRAVLTKPYDLDQLQKVLIDVMADSWAMKAAR